MIIDSKGNHRIRAGPGPQLLRSARNAPSAHSIAHTSTYPQQLHAVRPAAQAERRDVRKADLLLQKQRHTRAEPHRNTCARTAVKRDTHDDDAHHSGARQSTAHTHTLGRTPRPSGLTGRCPNAFSFATTNGRRRRFRPLPTECGGAAQTPRRRRTSRHRTLKKVQRQQDGDVAPLALQRRLQRRVAVVVVSRRRLGRGVVAERRLPHGR